MSALGGVASGFELSLGRRLMPVLLASAVAVVGGVAVGSGHAGLAAKAILVAGALAVGTVNWRWSVYGLIAYIPFSGVATILSYPHTQQAVLAKDMLFVLPAYVGFLAACASRRQKMSFAGAPHLLVFLFAGLVVLQAFNPSLPNLLVSLIGVKTWLFYIPLYFLGYHLIKRREQLMPLLGVMVLLAAIPAAIGIAEALVMYLGNPNDVYSLYGNAAAAVTQNFTQLATGGENLRRVASLFSFTTQYYLFGLSMVAVAYAWWQGGSSDRRRKRLGALAFGLMAIAALLSGERGAFYFVPALIALILLLRGARLGSWLRGATAAGAGLIIVVTVLGTSFARLFSEVTGVGLWNFRNVFVQGVPQALSVTWTGLGTGTDTIGSRYALPESSFRAGIHEAWVEGYWAKTILELGLLGLIVIVMLLVTVLVLAFRRHAQLRDPRLRAVSASLLAFLILTVAYSGKGQLLDLDPVNVYFWLLAGILMKLPALERAAARPDARDGPRAKPAAPRGPRRELAPAPPLARA